MDLRSRLRTALTRALHPVPAIYTFQVTHQGQIAPRKLKLGVDFEHRFLNSKGRGLVPFRFRKATARAHKELTGSHSEHGRDFEP
jgi:hypothetical protein